MREQTVHRVCPLCEATCGITVRVAEGRVIDLRGDKQDPFSRGFICPKAAALRALEEDPDRLRTPLVRNAAGRLQPSSWDDAFARALEGLRSVRTQHGANSVAMYTGNPAVHSLQAMLYGPALTRALGTANVYTATSIDQLPKMVSAQAMFGRGLSIPVPDIDRTDYLLMLGANPRVSNGSLMTAPNVPKRLDAIVERGGRVVVVDPRRSETAARASEHIAIRPGGDAAWLLALVHVLHVEGRVADASPHVARLAELEQATRPFTPERVEGLTGIAPEVTRRIAREMASAEAAVCYGRLGTTCQAFGTLASWAVDALNIVTGNLDRPGGAMFPHAAARFGGNRSNRSGAGPSWPPSTARSRVRGLPQHFGQFPAATLADEILTEGEGQVRGLVTLAGNPLLSVPGGADSERAFADLQFMVSVDFYLNETTRHADVILPPPSPLQRSTYDLALYQLAVRNVAKFSPAALPRPEGQPDEWEILLTLAKGLMGMESASLAEADAILFERLVHAEVGKDGGRWEGLTANEALEKLDSEPGPLRTLDLLLRTGVHGDGFGRRPEGLSLETLRSRHPHGVDLGALEPQLPGLLRTPGAKVDAAPTSMLSDLPRLEAALDEPGSALTLINRRELRSNNSWMHNLHPLVKGKPRCTLRVHPDDAGRLGLREGERARVQGKSGSVELPVQISDEMRPGVVSIPHGWGHGLEGTRMAVASEHAGVNVNRVSDRWVLDVPSGNAAFNGLPVEVVPLDGHGGVPSRGLGTPP